MLPTQRISRPAANEHWAFSDGSEGLLFDRQSMRLFPVESDLALALDGILQQADQLVPGSADAQSMLEILDAFAAQELPNPLAGLAMPDRPSVERQLRNRTQASRYLNKLAINVANDCNLACTYCYANEGLYGTPTASLLSSHDVERYVQRFAGQFDYIEGVQFMGGEPSMNAAAIRQAGVAFRRLVDEGHLLGVPRYTLVTNGLSFTRNFLDVCKDMEIELTVSLDGPQAVHDTARVRRNGSGSYGVVRRSIDRAVSAGIAVEFEPTFSRAHLKQGMGLIDLVEWFHAEFGVTTLHAPPMSENRYEKDGLGLSAAEKMREYCAVTEWGIDNLLARGRYLMHTFTARILSSLESRKRNSHICPAGNSLLSVSTQGDISPCWMYTDEAPFHMGHIDDNNGDLLGAKAKQVTDLLAQNELHSHPECQSCVIQPLCFGCKGGDYHATGTASGKNNCDYMRAMVVTAMMRVHSRPDLPATPADYYDRPAFGELVHERLRPLVAIKHEALAHPIKFVRRSRESSHVGR
jgi:uncharacterized protein